MPINQKQLEDESALRWTRAFVEHSDQHRRQLGLYQVWEEVLTSYLVSPEYSSSGNTSLPLGSAHLKRSSRGNPGRDNPVAGSETRELVDVLCAKLMLALFGGTRDFAGAKRRGQEDAKAARTVSDLVRYVFGRSGHYFSLNTAIKDCTLFGTGIVFGTWCLEEGPVTKYSIERLGGFESVNPYTTNGAFYDDLKLRRLDPVDFYDCPGYDLIQDMPGVARRFTMTPPEALAYAKRGKYGFDEAAVKEAISKAPGTDEKRSTDTSWRRDRVQSEKPHPDLKVMTGLEYWGQVPWLPADGERWRILTVLNGIVVRNVPWFLPERELPFYDIRANVIGGRFWGLSPAEAVRFQQDAANALLMLLMDGTIRSVHPPIIHDRNDILDKAALRAWRPDTLIASDYPDRIKTLTYGANFPQGWSMRGALQNEIQRNSGALGSIAGYGLGINRASATEANQTFQMALDRPEWMAQLIEKESLPRLGRGILRFYQMFLPDSQALADRIGQRPDPVQLEQIHGDWDVEFLGSRNAQSLQARLSAFDRILAFSMNGMGGVQIPMDKLIVQYLEDTGYDEIAQDVGDPEVIFQNVMMSHMTNGQRGMPGQFQPKAPGGNIAQQAGAEIPMSAGGEVIQ